MQCSVLRLMFRKMRSHLPQLLGMSLLVAVGVAFFVILYTIYLSYDFNAKKLFADYNYANLTYYGSFSEMEVQTLLQQKGIERAQGRTVRDYHDGDITLRAISLTNGVNTPYLYEGTMPKTELECLLIKKHAQARGLTIGDSINVNGKSLQITGIAASPEYVYLVKNERTPMAESKEFGVVFVKKEFFVEPYNEIVALTDSDADAEPTGDIIGAEKAVKQEDQINHMMFVSDLDQVRTFAYVFPAIFALLIVMVMYVMLKRAITKDRRQIGICKALGLEERRIVFIYTAEGAFAALVGAIIGCIAAMLICDTIIGLFAVMFEVPGLSFRFYPLLWCGVILSATLLCAATALISVRSVLKPLPAQAMRPLVPHVRMKGAQASSGLWNMLSFNTRYALKSAFRNKGRFLAMLLGMCGSCTLITFAMGFYDSAQYTLDSYFNDFACYDILMEFDLMPLEVEPAILKEVDSFDKALTLPVTIDDKEYRLITVEDSFAMQNIDTALLKGGIILPDYYAKLWEVGVGDTITINDTQVRVAGLSEQGFALSIYAGYEYAKSVFSDFPAVYNTVYAKDSNISALSDLLQENGISFSTLEGDKAGFSSIIESLNTLIAFMLVCAIILGLTVLYSVGLINLSTREYEYMFMGVMGYPLKSIVLAHIKESLLQYILSVPVGCAAGLGLVYLIKDAFSGDSFAIYPAIYGRSYVTAALIVAAMAVVMTMVTARHVAGLDIVEGLKQQDE